MSKRIKLTPRAVPVPQSREQVEALVREICEAKTEERIAKAEMDTEIRAIKECYEQRLSGISEELTPMVEAVHAWAEAHPQDFAGKKSLELLHGIVGWRVSPPAIKPMRGYTWSAVLDRLKALARGEYIRVKEEVNKDALLAARESEDLRGLYCQVEQADEFFIDPKLTSVSAREKV